MMALSVVVISRQLEYGMGLLVLPAVFTHYTTRRDSVTHHNAKFSVSSPEARNLSESVLIESRLAV